MNRVFVLVATLAIAAPAGAQSLDATLPAASRVPTGRAHAAAPLFADRTAAPSVGALFASLGHDVTHLASRDALVVLGIAGAGSLAALPADGDVAHHLAGSLPMDHLFEPGEGIGNGGWQIGAALGTYAAGRLTAQPGIAALGGDLVRAQIVSGGLTMAIKVSVDRERPDGGSYSFPSGHTSASFATATVVERHYGWKAGVPAYVAAAFVAGSRLQENRHYLSDVIFGAGIGIAAGRAVTVGHGPAAFALAPIAAHGGAGFQMTWLGRASDDAVGLRHR